jgi:hypothetical protein
MIKVCDLLFRLGLAASFGYVAWWIWAADLALRSCYPTYGH